MSKDIQHYWVIFLCWYDSFGRLVGSGHYPRYYCHKSSAVRRAKSRFGINNPRIEWVVKPVEINVKEVEDEN